MAIAVGTSIVVPVRNRPVAIGIAVASLLRQSCDDLEVIVVDDGSSDDTVTAVRAIGDPRVRLVALPVSVGPSGARNAGVAIAGGAVLGFLDSDDTVEGDWLAQLSEPLRDPSVVAASCGYRQVANGVDVDRHHRLTSQGPAFHNTRGCFQAGTFLVRRTVFDAVGGYAEELRFGENTELWLRLCDWAATNGASIAAVDEPLFIWNTQDRNVYNPAERGAGARYTLARHEALLARDPRLLAAHYAIAGTAAAHERQWRAAQRCFFRAWRRRPTDGRAIGRLVATLTPIWRTRHWPSPPS